MLLRFEMSMIKVMRRAQLRGRERHVKGKRLRFIRGVQKYIPSSNKYQCIYYISITALFNVVRC